MERATPNHALKGPEILSSQPRSVVCHDSFERMIGSSEYLALSKSRDSNRLFSQLKPNQIFSHPSMALCCFPLSSLCTLCVCAPNKLTNRVPAERPCAQAILTWSNFDDWGAWGIFNASGVAIEQPQKTHT